MRKFLSVLVFLICFGTVCGAAALFWVLQQYAASGPLQQPAFFVVEKGQGVGAIANKLADENVISNVLLFRIAARATGADTSIHAGEYRFEAGASMQAVLKTMKDGAIYQRQFTIPEGLTSWQIVQRLNEVEELEGEITSVPKEGSLMPDTYNYVLGETRQDKIDQMQQAMDRFLFALERNKPEGAPLLSRGEAVILASIVEKETAVGDERQRIAGVFHNRLKKGMKLQTDPTVIYAITGGKIKDEGQGPLGRRLLTKDLQFDSPYNTYKYAGLPPGPIANPGRASLEAVFNPEKHNYYYFVADGTGGHVFSKTLDEHNSNVAKWRKIRKQKGN